MGLKLENYKISMISFCRTVQENKYTEVLNLVQWVKSSWWLLIEEMVISIYWKLRRSNDNKRIGDESR